MSESRNLVTNFDYVPVQNLAVDQVREVRNEPCMCCVLLRFIMGNEGIDHKLVSHY